MVVTDMQVDAFRRDGFLVLEGFVDMAACDAARERAEEIVAAFEPSSHRSVFTTNDQVRVSDDQFLGSGDRITCFFEEEALAPDGSLTVPKERSINKIGHALHDLDPVFVKRAEGGGTEFEPLDDTPLPRPPDELEPLPVPAGTLVVLDGLLPHWSDANRSAKSRHAYSLHCISAAARYPSWNWLQRGPDLPLRPLAGRAATLRGPG